MSELKREWVRDAIDRVMIGLHDRRQLLGLAGLPEMDAHLRCLALEEMPTDAFQALLAVEDDEARERQIMALEAAQRRRHIMVEIRAVARSSVDGRLLFRWFCSCGIESLDHFAAEDARNEWGRHAGWLAPPEEPTTRQCQGCGKEIPFKAGRYCSRSCREEHRERT